MLIHGILKSLGMIAVCVGVGAASGWFMNDAVSAWYPTLQKPPLTPPDWVFGVVWPVL